MAGLWMFGETPEPSEAHAVARDLPVDDCIGILGLRDDQFVAPLDTPPKFNEPTGAWAEAKDHYTVVTLDEAEAADRGWLPGYYLLDITLPEARRRLKLPA